MKNSEKEKIFLNLFSENKDKVYRLCCGYLIDKNEIEDMFQEIMINIWSNLHTFRNEAKISTWIYRIAVNTSLLYNKKLQKKDSIFCDLGMDVQLTKAVEDIEENTEQQLKLSKLHQCISSLKKQDKLVVTLLLEGMSYSEISEIVGILTNYVAVKINRIKPILAKLMKENG